MSATGGHPPIPVGVVHGSRLIAEGLRDLLGHETSVDVSAVYLDLASIARDPLRGPHVLLADLSSVRAAGMAGVGAWMSPWTPCSVTKRKSDVTILGESGAVPCATDATAATSSAGDASRSTPPAVPARTHSMIAASSSSTSKTRIFVSGAAERQALSLFACPPRPRIGQRGESSSAT